MGHKCLKPIEQVKKCTIDINFLDVVYSFGGECVQKGTWLKNAMLLHNLAPLESLGFRSLSSRLKWRKWWWCGQSTENRCAKAEQDFHAELSRPRDRTDPRAHLWRCSKKEAPKETQWASGKVQLDTLRSVSTPPH